METILTWKKSSPVSLPHETKIIKIGSEIKKLQIKININRIIWRKKRRLKSRSRQLRSHAFSLALSSWNTILSCNVVTSMCIWCTASFHNFGVLNETINSQFKIEQQCKYKSRERKEKRKKKKEKKEKSIRTYKKSNKLRRINKATQ